MKLTITVILVLATAFLLGSTCWFLFFAEFWRAFCCFLAYCLAACTMRSAVDELKKQEPAKKTPTQPQ